MLCAFSVPIFHHVLTKVFKHLPSFNALAVYRNYIVYFKDGGTLMVFITMWGLGSREYYSERNLFGFSLTVSFIPFTILVQKWFFRFCCLQKGWSKRLKHPGFNIWLITYTLWLGPTCEPYKIIWLFKMEDNSQLLLKIAG